MTTIMDVLSAEWDDKISVTLESVVQAALESGLVQVLEEWYDENNKAEIDIKLRDAGSLQTEITVTVNGVEVAKQYGWHIQRVAAATIEQLELEELMGEPPIYAPTLMKVCEENAASIAAWKEQQATPCS